MHRSLHWLVVTAALAVLAGCTEKSRNPLSPNIAGPIEGVNISVPGLMSPPNGALIKVAEQPVTVAFSNGASNGERPVLYNVRLATDAEFVDVLHEATEIPADPSGQTTYRLPPGLDPETIYYWQAQADDGANSSDPSGVSSFEVFTPVVIKPPQIQVPNAGSSEGSASTLVINAPVVSGPAGNLTYDLQVASDQGFNNVVVSLSGALAGNSVSIDVASLLSSTSQVSGASVAAQSVSAQAASGLRGNTTYHWRARVNADGREGTVRGPWSASRTFRTPSNPNDLIAPSPVRPTGGSRTSSTRPDLVVRNPRVGAFNNVSIRYQVAADSRFNNVISSFAIPMSSGADTTGQPSTLAKDKLYYWRARAVSGQLRGPWSAFATFRTPNQSAPTGGGGGGGGGSRDQIDLSQVTWLHHNVSSWPKTSTITRTSIGNPPVCIDHTKRGRWPTITVGGTVIEGNPWVFAKVNGRWYAATYEWLRPGQECKGISSGNIGAHIKKSPLSNWRPRSGERIGLMVSTPARFGPQGARHERSNVVMVTWP